ncbi:hypothetical protein [Acidimangrovimonas pyrenivorans]|uniref:Uncharacterized protein n=1 Tax=Acidimangrovimonas pyrenivorans TaxID=2030798 RepID=A0ABV7AEI6_9RHOB
MVYDNWFSGEMAGMEAIMEHRLQTEDEQRVQEFLDRYNELCRELGLVVAGIGLHVDDLRPGHEHAYIVREPDKSLSLRHARELPDQAQSRILPRVGDRFNEAFKAARGKLADVQEFFVERSAEETETSNEARRNTRDMVNRKREERGLGSRIHGRFKDIPDD